MSERHAAFVMQPRTGPQRRAEPLSSGGSIADGPTAKSAPCLSAHRTALRCFFQRLPRNGPVGRLSAAFSNPPLQASPLHRAFFARGQKPACTEIFRLIYRPNAAFFGIRSFLYACRQNSYTFSKMLWRRPHARGTAPFLSFCVTSVKPHKKLFKCLSHFPKLLFCYCVPFSDSVY